MGACPVLWDTPGGRYDRSTYKVTDEKLLKQLMKIPDRKPEIEQQPMDITDIRISGGATNSLMSLLSSLNELLAA